MIDPFGFGVIVGVCSSTLGFVLLAEYGEFRKRRHAPKGIS